jgi:hypothetical protein
VPPELATTQACPHAGKRTSTAAPPNCNVVQYGSWPPCPATGTPLPALHSADELLRGSCDDAPLPARTAAESALLRQVAQWAKAFLTRPDPALGRPGVVCPYVAATLREQRFLLTLLRSAATKPHQTEQSMLRLGRHFLQLEPTAGRAAQLKTIVVLFPDLLAHETADVINGLHQQLKPYFLRKGMMLGEFFSENSKAGLHNSDFRPLRSAVPLLVIRPMVLTDIAFLSDDAAFVAAFLQNFGLEGCAEVRRHLERRKQTFSEAHVSLLLERVSQLETGV